MDAHLFRLFASAADSYLRDARMEKVREPAPGVLAISLFAHGEKKVFHMRYGKKDQFCFLGASRFSTGGSPPSHIMRIRKYFNNRRIVSVVWQFFRRKLWLLAAGSGAENGGGKTVWLCLDLVAGPEIHFLESGDIPMPDEPEWPESQEIATALDNWRQWPVLTPILRRTLVTLEEPEQKALLQDLRAGGGNIFLYYKKDAAGREGVARACAWPLAAQPGERLEEHGGEELLAAFEKAGNDLVLGRVFEAGQDKLLAPMRKKAARLRKLLVRLDADKSRLEAMRAREGDALALRENLWLCDKDAHLDSLTVSHEGVEREIPLDRRLSVLENMERFFHNARRGKRGLAMLAERKKNISGEIAALEKPEAILACEAGSQPQRKREAHISAAASLQANLPKNVQALASSDGYALLRGKDAKGNRAALKLAAPHDLWVHVETGPGAHVIIRRRHPADIVPEATIAEAGSLAACKSWLKDSATASIMYAEARHVKPARNGPAGKVVIDRLAMTRIVNVEKEVEQRLLGRNEPS